MRQCGVTLIVAACAAFTFSGCDRNPPERDTAEPAATSNDGSIVLDAVFSGDKPANALSVSALQKDASATGKVVVRGRIGGRGKPFVDGAAVFVLTDSSLKSCNQLHGDACKTPWDYCCESPETMAANTATIQIVGENGKPLRAALEGVHGLKPLVEIVVEGSIAERGANGLLVINARKIAVMTE